MKYIVVYNIKNFESAYCFDSISAANHYINECSEFLGKDLKKLKKINDHQFEMQVRQFEQKILINILECQDSDVSFELTVSEGEKITEAKQFKSREEAVQFVKKELAKFEEKAEESEDETGDWSVIKDHKVTHQYILTLILKNQKSSTGENVKRYANSNMNYFLKQRKDGLNQIAKNDKAAARSGGVSSILVGLAMAIIGGALTILSYSTTRAGGKYFVFTGLIIYGVLSVLAGIVQLIRGK